MIVPTVRGASTLTVAGLAIELPNVTTWLIPFGTPLVQLAGVVQFPLPGAFQVELNAGMGFRTTSIECVTPEFCNVAKKSPTVGSARVRFPRPPLRVPL